MNRTPKTDTARIDLRLKPAEKAKIQRLAKQCGLSTSEYVTQRALGFAPRTVLSDAFYDFYQKLCEVADQLDGNISDETERQVLILTDAIQAELLLPRKERDVTIWQPQASGQSKEN